jgi:hypothetical protein
VGDSDVANRTVGINARGSNAPERDVALGDFVLRLAPELEGTPIGELND